MSLKRNDFWDEADDRSERVRNKEAMLGKRGTRNSKTITRRFLQRNGTICTTTSPRQNAEEFDLIIYDYALRGSR